MEALLLQLTLAFGTYAVVGIFVCLIGLVALGFFAMYILPGILVRKVARATSQRDSRGEAVPLTGTARFGAANPGWIASLGSRAAPEHSLNEIIMRPTIGFRLVTVGVTGAAGFLMLTDAQDLFGGSAVLMAAMGALVGYYFICMNLYFLRYDRERIITQDWLFRRKEVAWRDVIDLRDNGQYQYVLALENGKKVEIQKYLVGMPDFLTYAKDQIAYHNRP